MNITWSYNYPIGALYQHSVILTPRLVLSPFFALDRETGECLWEKPESAERRAMLYPRALVDGVIVAEKCDIDGRSVTFRGIVRIDAATGALLSSSGSDGVSPARGLAAASDWLRARRAQTDTPNSAQLLSVGHGVITTRSGDVIDACSGAVVDKVNVATDAVPAWTSLPNLDANASSIEIPGIGALLPGHTQQSDEMPGALERFWQSWPLMFHLRAGGKILWVYDDIESKRSGLAGSLTYDTLRPPYAYFLLYKIKPHAFEVGRDFLFDVTLRALDLRTGEIVGNVNIADGPLHKWPSIADGDDQGLVLVYREANTKRSRVVYVSLR